MILKIESRTKRFWNTHSRAPNLLAIAKTALASASWNDFIRALRLRKMSLISFNIWAMMYSIRANKSNSNEIIIIIKAKMGNRFKNSGMH